MKKCSLWAMYLIAIQLLFCFGSGCAVRKVLQSDSTAEDFRRANRWLRARECTVILVDTTHLRMKDVVINCDSVRWACLANDLQFVAPFHDLRSVHTVSRRMGATSGALLGLLVGGVAGILGGTQHYESTAPGDSTMLGGMGDLGGAIAIGFGSAGAGALLGGLIGHSVGAPISVHNDAYLDLNSPIRLSAQDSGTGEIPRE